MIVLRTVVLLICLTLIYAKILPLNCNLKRRLVNTHNALRLQLAKGEVDGQPAASSMSSLVWDEELAEKAENWAQNNEFRHNPDRTIPSNRFKTGENLYIYWTTAKNRVFKPEEGLNAWFDENKDFEYKELSSEDFMGSTEIGHYTQMAWANTFYVGCAVSKYNDDGWDTTLLVCNYGPQGNILGEAPYPSGNPSNALFCGASDCSRYYGNQCSR